DDGGWTEDGGRETNDGRRKTGGVGAGEEDPGFRDLGTHTISNTAEPVVHHPSSVLAVLEGRLRQGFKFADIGLFVATDAELFGSARPVVGRRRSTGGIPISTVLDLRENDFVVHVHHGIGVYRGLVKRKVEGTERDYLYVQ